MIAAVDWPDHRWARGRRESGVDPALAESLTNRALTNRGLTTRPPGACACVC